MRRTSILVMVLMGLVSAIAFAQMDTADPAVQEAKEETAVVFDLGRMFGYIRTMESEDPSLALNSDQIRELYVIMTAITQTDRIEGDQADEWLLTIEDDILAPAQLMYVDKLFMARTSSSGTGEGTGTGNGNSGAEGTATGSIATYVAGGKFNPILDTTRNLGQDFAEYYEELADRR